MVGTGHLQATLSQRQPVAVASDEDIPVDKEFLSVQQDTDGPSGHVGHQAQEGLRAATNRTVMSTVVEEGRTV